MVHRFDMAVGINGNFCQPAASVSSTGEFVRYTDYARLTAEITTLRARLETVEAETIERAVKRIKADKDIQGLVKARIFIALRNLEPRHD